MNRPPRIGITTSLKDGEQRLDRRYVLAVERAGAVPMLAPMAKSEDVICSFGECLDGLVVVGGPAITQGLVGNLPEDLDETDSARLFSDQVLLRYANEARMPVLGICYGMQLANALAGGTIYADVEAQVAGSIPHSEKRDARDHPVLIEPDSHLFRIMGASEIVTNTRHIQAVADVAPGLRASGRTTDGVVEAVESEDGRVIGVQFHPERMSETGFPLFLDLVRKATSYSEQTTANSA